ncbi:MAG: hypothetical protein LC798_16710 [Chloroflexi bacterium]|nr:hypothetical protein [Chloroflexota bacterium]
MPKTSQLPAAAALTGSEKVAAVQGTQSVRTTAAAIAAAAPSGTYVGPNSPVPIADGFQLLTPANPHAFFTKTYSANGVDNHVLHWGYNLAKTAGSAFGAKIDAADVAFQFDLEPHYYAGGANPQYSEMNLDWWSKAATGNVYRRLMSCLVDHATFSAYWEHRGGTFDWKDPTGANIVMQVISATRRVGFGTGPSTTLHLRSLAAVSAKNEQLLITNDGTYHLGMVFSTAVGDAYTTDTKAIGLFGGANNYLTGTADAAAWLIGTGVPHMSWWRAANVNSPGVRNLFRLAVADPTAGNTVASLCYHNGTAVVTALVTVGAADSGGTGFKALRVPN